MQKPKRKVFKLKYIFVNACMMVLIIIINFPAGTTFPNNSVDCVLVKPIFAAACKILMTLTATFPTKIHIGINMNKAQF